jgi:Tfp pilus assembly protein PilF
VESVGTSAERSPGGGAEASARAPVDLLAQAEAARQAARYEAARELYTRAASGQGVTAEAAWVALARMELALGNAAQARAATKQRQQRFGQGTLAPESLWIDVRAYRQSGELGLARELAAELVRRWPGSPQARAAQDWLSGAR